MVCEREIYFSAVVVIVLVVLGLMCMVLVIVVVNSWLLQMKFHLIAIMQAMQQWKRRTDELGSLVNVDRHCRDIGSRSSRGVHRSTITNARRHAISTARVGVNGATASCGHSEGDIRHHGHAVGEKRLILRLSSSLCL